MSEEQSSIDSIQPSRQTIIEREAWRLMLQKEINQQVQERLATDESNLNLSSSKNIFLKNGNYPSSLLASNNLLNNHKHLADNTIQNSHNKHNLKYLNSLREKNLNSINHIELVVILKT